MAHYGTPSTRPRSSTPKPIPREILENGYMYREIKLRSAVEPGQVVQGVLYDPTSPGTTSHILTIVRQPTVLSLKLRNQTPHTKDVLSARRGVYVGIQAVERGLSAGAVNNETYYEKDSAPHRPSAEEAVIALQGLMDLRTRVTQNFEPMILDAQTMMRHVLAESRS